MYAIRRVEEKPGDIGGWRVLLIRQRKRFQKTFYDTQYGGSRKARAAAIAWRNRIVAKYLPMNTREYRQIVRKGNKSGEPGVFFFKDKRMPDGMWQAKLCIGLHKQITKSFGVRRYGYAEAFRRAVEARAELLELIEDEPRFRHPEAKRLTAKLRKNDGHHRKSKTLQRLLPARRADDRGGGERHVG